MSEDTRELDLVVIGGGPGGYVAAIRAAQLGLRTGLVEKDADLGGTCLHRGCIPTKAWLHSAAVYEEARRALEFGVAISGEIDFDGQRAREYRHGIVTKNARGVAHLMRKNGIQVWRGWGRLQGEHEVVVEGDDGTHVLRARSIVLATGSSPRPLGIAPADGQRILDSDQILELEQVPPALVVLGGGAVGVEFASIFRSLGAEVQIVEMLPRLLPLEDEDSSRELERAFRKRGIGVRCGARLEQVESREQGLQLRIADTDGAGSQTLETAMLLVAVGRQPVSFGLGAEELGLGMAGGFFEVNAAMQTNIEHMYAIGDVVQTPQLAHVASAEGVLAAEHAAGLEPRPLDYERVPWCTYCDPEVASVGLTEAAARERGADVDTGRFPFAASGKAAILGRTGGFVKVVREKRYDEVLGVHIVGPHATDLIAEACVALRLEATTEELVRTMHAHPTLSEAVAEAAHAAVGHPIHI